MSLPDSSDAMSNQAASLTAVSSAARSLFAVELTIFIAAFAILWPTTVSLMKRFDDTDGTYTHGYFIVLISAWLLWRGRDRIQSTAARPFFPALLAVALTMCVWLLSVRSGIQTGHQALLPVLIWLGIASALGLRAAWLVSFPVGFLYFAIPVWGLANDVLQSLTAAVVGVMLHATGVVATIDGNLIHLPVGTFEVAAGCSGLHFFIVALSIAALYGEIHRDSIKVRIQLLMLAAVLSAVTNWMRVYVIIVAGYLTDMQHYLVRVEHTRIGWVVFVVMMAGFVLIARRLPTNDVAADTRRAAIADTARPILWTVAAFVLVLMAVGPVWNHMAAMRAANVSMERLLPVVASAQWRGPLPPVRFNWAPQFNGADHALHGRYLSDDGSIEMYVAAYAAQHQGKELVGYDNSILGAERAEILRRAVVDGWQELEIRTAAGIELIRYRYRIGNARTPSSLHAQLSYGLGSLVGAPLSTLIAFRSDCTPDCKVAQQRVTRFVAEIDRNEANSPVGGVRQ